MAKITEFDAAVFLDSEQTIVEYLTACQEDSNPNVFLGALMDVAKARGMSKVAKDAGLGRAGLYKALSPGSHPRFETVSKIMHALGVKLTVTPNQPVA